MGEILIFMVGSTLGSFLGLCIDRIPRGESIVRGRSHCESCQLSLSFWEMIPIFSQVLSRGHCFHCHAKIPWRYALLELSAGLLALLSLTEPNEAIFLLMSLVLAIYDQQDHSFPLSVWLVFTGLLWLITPFSVWHLLWILLALIVEKTKVPIGTGDILWFYSANLIFSFSQVVCFIEIASVLGIIYYLLRRKKGEIAFIPCLTAAVLIYLPIQVLLL